MSEKKILLQTSMPTVPKSCFKCHYCRFDGSHDSVCKAFFGEWRGLSKADVYDMRPEWCPLVELEESK